MSQDVAKGLTRLIEELSVYSCVRNADLIQQTLVLLEAMGDEGLSPSPILTYELLCALTSQQAQTGTKRQRAQELRARYRELISSLKPRPSPTNKRVTVALRTLFLGAPEVGSLSSVIELERVALTEGAVSDDSWVQWRRHAESGLLRLTWYRWHLMYICLLKNRSLGLSLIDESALKIVNMTRDQLDRLQVKARVGLGDDDQHFRSAAGTFFEIGFDTMPSDPTRISASDLPLFAERSEVTRASLLMKISDSSLSVRFGEVQRPARRKARVRVMVMLSDHLDHHMYHASFSEPLIDLLRQVSCHLIPNLFRLIKQTEIEGEVHLIRSGVCGHGSLSCGKLSADYPDYPAYRSSQSAVIELMTIAPWFFEDYPLGVSNNHTSSPPPANNHEDAIIGIWLGGLPPWLRDYPLYQEIGFELGHDLAQVHTYTEGTSKRATLDVLKQITRSGHLDPHAIVDIVLQQLDLSISEGSKDRDISNPWEETRI